MVLASLSVEKPSVLVVDDVSANLLAFEAVLAPLGANFVPASSGEEALRLLLQQEFACILMDVQMPGLDGFETARLIRGRAKTGVVPLVFISAVYREESNIVRGYSEGAVDYITKPVNPDVLRAKVGHFLDEYARNRALWRENAELRERLAREHEERTRDVMAALAAVERERAGLAGAFEQAPVALVVLRGEQLVVELANRLAMRFAAGHITVGRPARDGLPLQQAGVPEEWLTRARETGEGFTLPMLSLRPEAFGRAPDELVVISVMCEPLRTNTGEVDGLVLSAYEVTDQVRSCLEKVRPPMQLPLSLR